MIFVLYVMEHYVQNVKQYPVMSNKTIIHPTWNEVPQEIKDIYLDKFHKGFFENLSVKGRWLKIDDKSGKKLQCSSIGILLWNNR